MTDHLVRKLFLLAAIGWAALIYFLSDQSGIVVVPLFHGQDKVLHVMAYGILGFLVLGALHPGTKGYGPSQVWIAVSLVTFYGVLDEFHQRFVPGRMADTWDVVADAAGAMLGVYVLYALTRLRKERGKSA